jgi:hypothetical protein
MICIKIIVGLSCLLKYVYLILFFSHLICEIFHFSAFGFSHYICVQSLDLIGTHFFVAFMMRKSWFPWCCVKCFCIYCKECEISLIMWANPYFYCLLFNFWSMNCHCNFSGWCVNVGWSHCCWPHSHKFGFTSSFILCDCCNKWQLRLNMAFIAPIPSKHVFHSSHKGI